MARFRIKNGNKKDNSHPFIKISIRRWILNYFQNPKILDVYGSYGLMHKTVWMDYEYKGVDGDAIDFIQKNEMNYDIFDIDPYSSPFEAIDIILNKTNKDRVGIVYTDGYLRRVCMMKTKLSEFFTNKLNCKERDGSLMSSIYYNYDKWVINILKKINSDFGVVKFKLNYGIGTWKQCTCYCSVVLERK